MKAEFDAKDNGLILTVTVTRARQWRIRLWIAKWLMKLASYIAWIDFEIRPKDREDDLFCNWLIERNRYRLMILKLLDGAPDTNVPQETRNKAYDLLDEYFVE